jgi:hypothetical protein
MTRRYLTVLLIVALAGGGTSAFAGPRTDPQGLAALPVGATNPTPEATPEQKPNDKLRSDISRLLVDARAGRIGTIVQPRQQPAQSNHLSKKTKVTIAVVAALVIMTVVIASKANDAPGRGSIPIF